MQIDETDRNLIAILSRNARTPMSELARQLGVARTTAQARLERLEHRGIIKGYALTLGGAARAPLRATALISVEPRAGAAVLARLQTMDSVSKAHTTSGRFDFLVELTAHTTEELDASLDRIGEIKGVNGSESLIHLSTKIDR